jgi:hypothetical protein
MLGYIAQRELVVWGIGRALAGANRANQRAVYTVSLRIVDGRGASPLAVVDGSHALF